MRSTRAREIRSVYASEFGVDRPRGIAYVDGRFLVVGAGAHGMRVSSLSSQGDLLGSARLPELRAPSTLTGWNRRLAAVDASRLMNISARLGPGASRHVRSIDLSRAGLRRPRAASVDPTTGTLLVLDRDGRSIVRISLTGSTPEVVSRSAAPARGVGRLRGIAFNPADGLVYVASRSRLLGLDAAGSVRGRHSLRSLRIDRLRGMTFAPSTDTSDVPGNLNLYLADAGSATRYGRVVEATLAAPVVLAAQVVTGSLVQVIDTSAWNPASPDPSGIAWMGKGHDRLSIADSEVDEVTGAGQRTTNLWQITRAGAVVSTSSTLAYSREPTGLGVDRATNTLYISDDDGNRVVVNPLGSDATWTPDDPPVRFINVTPFGSTDAEDPEFLDGVLYFMDGVSTEVYRVDPGSGGIYGDGNDTATHCDVGQYGPTDVEGLSSDPVRHTLLVGDRRTRQVYEISPDCGQLFRIINVRVTGMSALSGLAQAPASNGTGLMNLYVVDRQQDNGPDPTENDGKLFEVTYPGATPADAPPLVSMTAPPDGSVVSGTVSLTATASDDVGVSKVEFFDGNVLIGFDTSPAGGWTTAWATPGATEGEHSITAKATDTTGQTALSAPITLTVDNVDSPPVVSITAPAAGSIFAGASVAVAAAATDDKGVSQVAFLVDGIQVAVDANPSGGWSVVWNLAGVADGQHAIAAVAQDTTGHAATSAPVVVTVDHGNPVVSITSPTGGTVSSIVSISASATDAATSVAQVVFRVDGAPVGTDTGPSDGWSSTWDTTGVANGQHTLTATAIDAAGNAAVSGGVTVIVQNEVTGALDVPIATGADDIEERASDGRIQASSNDLDLVLDGSTLLGAVGLRFTNVLIPKGATITAAWIQFRSDEGTSDATALVVAGQAADDAAPFRSARFSLSSQTERPRTTARVTWQPVAWSRARLSGLEQRTPDLKQIVGEIVSRPGWANGNALALIIVGSGRRVADSFEGAAPPILHVEYALGG
jgi:hypothetical protein